MSRRSNYTAKFKTKIVLEVLKEERELGVIAAENNLNPNMVRKWRKELLKSAASGSGVSYSASSVRFQLQGGVALERHLELVIYGSLNLFD